MNNESFEYGITPDIGAQFKWTSEDAAKYEIAKDALLNQNFAFVPIIEYWANKEHSEAQRLFGECALYGKGMGPDLEKAAFYLKEAAKNGEYDAYLGLSDVENMKQDYKKSMYWLLEGMKKGNLRCAKSLVKILGGKNDPSEIFLYYEALTMYIPLEEDSFEKYNASAERSQVLEKIKNRLKEAADNHRADSADPDFNKYVNSLLALSIPADHREGLTEALAEYNKSKDKAEKIEKNAKASLRTLNIALAIAPFVISLICYYRYRYVYGLLGVIFHWCIPIFIVGGICGALGSLKKPSGVGGSADPLNAGLHIGGAGAAAMLVVILFMGFFGLDSETGMAITQFIILEAMVNVPKFL